MKSKLLKSLCICACFTTIAIYPKTNIQIDKVGEKTVKFINNLEKHIPKIVKDIQSKKNIAFDIISAFLEQYGNNLNGYELLSLQSSFDKTMGNKFGELLTYLLIESVLIACENNLKKHNAEKHYLDKVQTSIKNIRKTLKSTKKVDSAKLTKDENTAINKMLKAVEYQKLINLLNITLNDVQIKFEKSIKKAVKFFLDKEGIEKLGKLLTLDVFDKIKNHTDTSKLSGILNSLAKSIGSAKEVVLECSSYLAG